jgi:hypothetical protein
VTPCPSSHELKPHCASFFFLFHLLICLPLSSSHATPSSCVIASSPRASPHHIAGSRHLSHFASSHPPSCVASSRPPLHFALLGHPSHITLSCPPARHLIASPQARCFVTSPLACRLVMSPLVHLVNHLIASPSCCLVTSTPSMSCHATPGESPDHVPLSCPLARCLVTSPLTCHLVTAPW